jgi:hypothetical protein
MPLAWLAYRPARISASRRARADAAAAADGTDGADGAAADAASSSSVSLSSSSYDCGAPAVGPRAAAAPPERSIMPLMV